ncbi:MAG: glycoside hydrolase family 28 protein [Bacteroidales bacterium]|nr:glycoside hydrolase family 28 protein [Bacteroidales bacterium]
MGTSCAENGAQIKGEFDSLFENLPFEMGMVSRPSIPAFSVSVTDFGGNGNGIFDNTNAFKKAMEHLSSKGGGHLVVPAGIWKTGPIEILSNIDLHIVKDAVIIFDPTRELYPIISTSFEGLDTYRCESPLYAQNAENISITGGGVIDGSGQSWRPVKKAKLTSAQWKEVLARGGVTDEKGSCWYPSEEYIEAEKAADMNVIPEMTKDLAEKYKDFLRPVMVSLRNCKNVLLEGCTFQNSPAWNIHPLLCTNMIIKDITVRNPWYAQNGDGIDIESCTDVVLVSSTFDVGDDGICVKSGKDEAGRKRGIPTKGLIVSDCTVYHGHGGFVVGSEMSGGVENVKVSNCRFLGTDVGLRFKSKRGRGGVVKNIYINDIYMTDIVTETLLFDLFYGGKSAVEALEDGNGTAPVETIAVDETTPSFRDIYISNIVCNGAGRAMFFNGLPEMPVKNVNVTNCTITSKSGIEICRAEDVTLKNVKVTPEKGEAVIKSEVKNFIME